MAGPRLDPATAAYHVPSYPGIPYDYESNALTTRPRSEYIVGTFYGISFLESQILPSLHSKMLGWSPATLVSQSHTTAVTKEVGTLHSFSVVDCRHENGISWKNLKVVKKPEKVREFGQKHPKTG